MTYTDLDVFKAHAAEHGLPNPDLPLVIRQAYQLAGMAVPATHYNINIVTPPPPGSCAHCGTPVPEGQHAAAHALAAFEHLHLPDGNPARLLVNHCDACVRTAPCSPDTPGGHCEFPGELTLGGLVLPLSPRLLRNGLVLARFAVAAVAVKLLLFAAIQTSQGQQVAALQGGNNNIGASSGADATSGHGYNAGAIRIYTGAAPATANALETGTKLADVALPATAFGTASAAIPSVLTANAISNSTILATGTAGYGRLVANADDGTLSTSQRRIMFAVGTSGSDLNFNTLSLVINGTLSVTSLTVTYGN